MVFFATVEDVCIIFVVTVVAGAEFVTSGSVVATVTDEVVTINGSGARNVTVAEELVFPVDSFTPAVP